MTTQPYNRRTVVAWAMFDFGNSAFSALVLTFIFSTYFANVIAPDPVTGTGIWSRWGVMPSGLIVALLSPFMGALADRGGLRKRMLFVLTVMAIAATASLFTVLPGQVTKGLILFVIANIGVEMGMVFYNSFLPDIAPQERIGRISGFGWAFGYAGGLIAMILALIGFVQTDTPWFGFSVENSENIRATNLLTAAWFGVFCLPFFIWVKDKRQAGVPNVGRLFSSTVAQMRMTFKEIRQYRQIVRLLLARIFYNDAILTIFSFGGIYAKGTFGFTFSEIMYFGIVLNVAAGLGAFALAFMDDMIGGKRTVQFTNVMFIGATFLAIVAPNKLWFWIAGIVVGLFSGPNQAASRSLMGRFVPPNKESEFFGFYAFSGKATAFIGPLFLGILTEVFNTQRAGFVIVLLLFAVGMILLRSVDEEEGKQLSGRSGVGGVV